MAAIFVGLKSKVDLKMTLMAFGNFAPGKMSKSTKLKYALLKVPEEIGPNPIEESSQPQVAHSRQGSSILITTHPIFH